jgi:hypothetical protein
LPHEVARFEIAFTPKPEHRGTLQAMPKKQKPIAMEPTEAAVRSLLQRYDCPVPFHAVRTRFLGAIVSPVARVSPLDTVKDLWGGALPAFDNAAAANELLQALIMGLWNRLTRHQKPGEPFHLLRLAVPLTTEGLATLALTRREEIDGFTGGLFGPEERIDLAERGHRALGELGEIRAMLAGVYELVHRPGQKVDSENPVSLIDGVNKVTRTAEHQIYETVLSSVEARRKMSHALPVAKPTFH